MVLLSVAAEDLPAGVELTTDYAAICDSVRINGASYLPAVSVADRSAEKRPSAVTAA